MIIGQVLKQGSAMTAVTKNDVIPAGYFAPEDDGDGDERTFAAWLKCADHARAYGSKVMR